MQNQKSLEDVILFNEIFDDHVNGGHQESFISWLKSENEVDLVNAYVKKYFYFFKDKMTSYEGIWLLDCVYFILSWENKVEIFNLVIENEVSDVYYYYENKPEFKDLMLSIDISLQFKIIWIAQKTYKDLGFLWENKSIDVLLSIADNLYLSDYKDYKPNTCFQNYLLSLFSYFDEDVKKRIIKKNLLSIMKLTDSTNKLPEIFLDALMCLFFNTCSVKDLIIWEDLLEYVNLDISAKYDNLEDWLNNYQNYFLSPCKIYIYQRLNQFINHSNIKNSIDEAIKKNYQTQIFEIEESESNDFKL